MGNGFGKIKACFSAPQDFPSSPPLPADHAALDEGLGHSFCYVRPATTLATEDLQKPPQISGVFSSKVHSDADAKAATFRSISGASVSANTSTALTAASSMPAQYNTFVHRTSSNDCAAAFESTDSFASMPLHPAPRTFSGFFSGPLEQTHNYRGGFLSGPLERATYMSGPLERISGPIERSFSSSRPARRRPGPAALSRILRSAGAPLKRAFVRTHRVIAPPPSSAEFSSSGSSDLSAGDDSTWDSNPSSQNLQWAQGKAGEDRVHVVISDDYGWLFVGIYDGFNGPDAPDYLLSNLYNSVHRELRCLVTAQSEIEAPGERNWRENTGRRQNEWFRGGRTYGVDHCDVLRALEMALSKTEEAYLEMADKAVSDNPELALMGSCVLVMLMMGEDVYVMNVGDSRAVLAQELRKKDSGQSVVGLGDSLQRIREEQTAHEMGRFDFASGGFGPGQRRKHSLGAVQLTFDHSTSVQEEVKRIKVAHLDDVLSIVNDRVKGTLKVTRAFGAGFLKQPKWNDALLEMFRIDYVGTAPYITCTPDLCHHRLGPDDHFLILSSDGLYQYFTNEEVVNEVEWFMESFPDGDPAQHLVGEVLFRAAKKAGMDFHELLEIPQGDRRKYHDDVSVMVVSLEGRIWRSSV